MKKFWILTLILAAATGCKQYSKTALPDNFDPTQFTVKPLVECNPRGGAPNFFKKLEDGASEVRIAYFGGSITAQNGYRVFSREYIQALYPGTEVKEINAAIGGTATDLGVYRCWHDVLKEKPDLVFVEFACNDSGTRPLDLRRNLEGIVRQIWKDNPATDIVFLYVVTAREEQEMLDRKMMRSASVMEDIAEYYAIPSINFGDAIAPMLEAGTLVMQSDSGLDRTDGKTAFSADGTHPFESTGHKLYEAAIERCLPVIKDAGRRAQAHKMPAPMVADCLSEVATIGFDDPRITISGDYHKDTADAEVTSPFRNRSDDFFTFEPGAEISFRFRGSAAAIYDILGPRSCSLLISVDGGEPRKSDRIDGYCTYHRLALLSLCSDLDPEQEHTITVKVSETAPDKREILFESNRGDYDSNPAKYAPLHYFAGCIFVAGEVI